MNGDKFENRKTTVIFLFCLVTLLLLVRLFYLQIFNDTLKDSATQNSTRVSVVYPSRGLIFDRNNKLIVANKPSYDLMVNEKNLKPFDTLNLSNILGVDQEFIKKQFQKKHPNPFILIPLVTSDEYARLQERLYKFPGFYVQTRTVRSYEYNFAAHVLGYLGEVSPTDIVNDQYYLPGDYIGKSGVEMFYETHLRGKKGKKYEIIDALGRTHGKYNEGIDDEPAVNGGDLTLSIDIKLQEYIEKLMQNKRGSVVAIDPSSGEILAMVSAPTYNLSSIVGRDRSKEFASLNENQYKPQTNRAINGLYSPGSTFKMANALVALQEGAITPNTLFSCQGTSSSPIRCTHFHGSPNALLSGIENSCNPYFWQTLNLTLNYGKSSGNTVKSQFRKWGNYMKGFGFGLPPEIDIPFAKKGNIPTVEDYDKIYGGQWNALTIRSLAIGQGEIQMSPLQLANYTAIIANRGFYYPPHFVKRDDFVGEKDLIWTKHVTPIDSINFEHIVKGMELVFSGSKGTARWYKNKDITMAGKTGTVENSRGKDHSIFIAFAPVDNPKIAICVVVENAGFGATWAAPIATLSMEKYILDSIPSYHKSAEERMLNANLLETNE